MEELRNDGRAVVLVGDLNIVADAQADSHPGKWGGGQGRGTTIGVAQVSDDMALFILMCAGLRCPWSSDELGWFSRVQSWYVDSFRHLHPDRTDAYTCWDQVRRGGGR